MDHVNSSLPKIAVCTSERKKRPLKADFSALEVRERAGSQKEDQDEERGVAGPTDSPIAPSKPLVKKLQGPMKSAKSHSVLPVFTPKPKPQKPPSTIA